MQVDRQIETLLKQFQRSSEIGPPPNIRDFVRSVAKDLRGPLAQKLIPLDVQLRLLRSETPQPADYEMFGQGGVKLAERAIQASLSKSKVNSVNTLTFDVDKEAERFEETLITGRRSTIDGDRSVSVNRSLRSAPDPSAKTFGRFELKSVLGKGSFGEVHKAWDPHLERFVALKIPLFDKTAKKQIARFLSEAKSTARLKHQNIVATLESGTVGDQLYIASELIEGERLSERLERRKLSPKVAVKIAAKLANALAYAHENNVVHRDIKPENIILDVDGEPHIMDFGLAKRTDDDEHMTTEGALLGTPAYMSPEQARGENDRIGPQSDQYSLAVVLFHMLCGKPPYDGPPHSVVLSVSKGTVPAPRSVNKLIDKPLDAIVRRALAGKPEERYPSCSAFGIDLDKWASGEAMPAVTSTTARTTVLMLRRFGPVVGLSTALCFLLGYIGLTGWSFLNPVQPAVGAPTVNVVPTSPGQYTITATVKMMTPETRTRTVVRLSGRSTEETYTVMVPVQEEKQLISDHLPTFEIDNSSGQPQLRLTVFNSGTTTSTIVTSAAISFAPIETTSGTGLPSSSAAVTFVQAQLGTATRDVQMPVVVEEMFEENGRPGTRQRTVFEQRQEQFYLEIGRREHLLSAAIPVTWNVSIANDDMIEITLQRSDPEQPITGIRSIDRIASTLPEGITEIPQPSWIVNAQPAPAALVTPAPAPPAIATPAPAPPAIATPAPAPPAIDAPVPPAEPM